MWPYQRSQKKKKKKKKLMKISINVKMTIMAMANNGMYNGNMAINKISEANNENERK